VRHFGLAFITDLSSSSPAIRRDDFADGSGVAKLSQGGQTWITGILRLIKAASLLQGPFDDKKDALVTKHLQGGLL
jgi:hypothetical protein